MSDDLSKLKAARAQLKTERETIIAAAVESGAAALASVVVSSHVPECDRAAAFEEAKARKLAELRQAGEKREVFFSRTIITTGVPRGEPISTAKVEADPLVTPRYPKPDPLPVRPARVAPDMTEAKKITATISPRDERDLGVVFYGQYRVEGGQLHVADDKGQHLTSAPVGPDDNVEVVARRLLREKMTSVSDFFGRIDYRKKSIV